MNLLNLRLRENRSELEIIENPETKNLNVNFYASHESNPGSQRINLVGSKDEMLNALRSLESLLAVAIETLRDCERSDA